MLENNQTTNARLLETPREAVELLVVVAEAVIAGLDVAVVVVEDDLEVLDVVDPDDEPVAAEPDGETVKV